MQREITGLQEQARKLERVIEFEFVAQIEELQMANE
jgi:hypothetical protein